MAKYKNGILGAFSGKIGPVVGANWRGINYMRVYNSKVSNPQTLLQREQRAKMSMIAKFIKPIRGIINIGWKLYATDMTPSNAATKYHLANAIIGNYPDFNIDPEKILISSGTLTPALNARVEAEAGEIATVEWNNNSGTGSAYPTDNALILIFNPEKYEAVYQTDEAQRSMENTNITLPQQWKDNTVICYLGFASDNKKQIANSVYLGEITVI